MLSKLSILESRRLRSLKWKTQNTETNWCYLGTQNSHNNKFFISNYSFKFLFSWYQNIIRFFFLEKFKKIVFPSRTLHDRRGRVIIIYIFVSTTGVHTRFMCSCNDCTFGPSTYTLLSAIRQHFTHNLPLL